MADSMRSFRMRATGTGTETRWACWSTSCSRLRCSPCSAWRRSWSSGCELRKRNRLGAFRCSCGVPRSRPAVPGEVLVSTTTAGIIFLAVLVVALVVVHVPFGDYMYRVYTSENDSYVERLIYRAIGVDSRSEQTWGAYARSVLAFSSISILFLFVFQLVQGKLPLHLHDPATQMT